MLFRSHCRVKALSWLSAETKDGDALGRRVLLEGIVVVVLSLLCPGSPRETHAGSGEGGAPASLASWSLALDVPPTGGSELGVGGDELSSSIT